MSPRKAVEQPLGDNVFVVEDDVAPTNGNAPHDDATDGYIGETAPIFEGESMPENEERPPVRREPRQSAADLIAMAWGGFGMYLTQTGRDVPVGRVLALQAPLAGAKFDDILAGTFIDRILQPFVKAGDTVEGVGALIMFPLLVGMYERNPESAPIVYPILSGVIRSQLADLAPLLKKEHQSNQRTAKAIAELESSGLFEGMTKGDDPVDFLIQQIFAPPPGYEDETPDA